MVGRRSVLAVVLSVAVLWGVGAVAQGLIVSNVWVNDPLPDQVADTPCHPNFTPPAPFHWKGNNDGALSPGERVFLQVQLLNRTGYTITSCTGVLTTSSPDIQVLSPNCATGEEGARWDCPSPDFFMDNTVSVNVDPFYLNISQNVPCLEDVLFTLELTYATGGGNCSPGPCTLTYEFKLPAFSFADPDSGLPRTFVPGWDRTLFPSSTAQLFATGATDGREIGLFFSKSSWTQLARLDFDGNIIKDPENTNAGSLGPWRAALYNPTPEGGRYELYTTISGGSQVNVLFKGALGWDGRTVVNDGGGPIDALFNPDTQHIALVYTQRNMYPEGQVKLVLLDRYTRYPVTVPVPGVNPILLGWGNVRSNGGGSCSIGYLPWIGRYYVAYERHIDMPEGEPDTDAVVVVAVNAWTAEVLGEVVLPLPYFYEAMPSLAVDPFYGQVAVAFVSRSTPGAPSVIQGALFDYDLNPLTDGGDPDLMLSSPAGTEPTQPRLQYMGGFFLGWVEANTVSNSSSRVLASRFLTGFGGGGSIWEEIQREPLSEEWYQLGDLKGLKGFDQLYFLWSDSGPSMEYPWGLRMGTARPLDPRLPYNLDPANDVILSQAYQDCVYASVATLGSSFYSTWLYQASAGMGSPKTICGRQVSATGAMGPIQTLSDPAQEQPGDAAPVALAANGSYQVFWKGPADAEEPYTPHFYRWNGTPQRFQAYESTMNAKLLSAAVDAAGTDAVILYKDQVGSETFTHLFLGNGSGAPVRLTQLTDTFGIWDGAVTYNPGALDGGVWAVAWSEQRATVDGPRFQVRFARFNSGLAQVGGEEILYSSPSGGENLRRVDIAATDERIFILSTRVSSTGREVSLVLTTRLASGAVPPGLLPEDAESLQTASVDAGNVAFWRLGLRYDLSQLTVSYLIRSQDRVGPYGMSWRHEFIYEPLDCQGTRTLWPQRIASFNTRMEYDSLTFDVCPTSRGGAAVYTQDVITGQANVGLAMLEWPAGYPHCSVYNQAPVPITTEAYGTTPTDLFAVEYGQSVVLNGAVTDDDLGDSVATAGWDLNGDEDIDRVMTGGNYQLTVTRQMQEDNYMYWPQDYPIHLVAFDRGGKKGVHEATLRIRDTTGPTVAVNTPNGGETLRVGQTVTVTWDGTDNHEIQKWDAYYSTDYGAAGGEHWLPLRDAADQPALAIPSWIRSFDWVVPNTLSATCRVRVVASDWAQPTNNTGQDLSDRNFYVVQLTTTAVRTLVLWNSARADLVFGAGTSGPLLSKLTELVSHTKVNGVLLDLANVPGLEGLYTAWDNAPTSTPEERAANVAAANAVANAIRAYVVQQVTDTFTNAQYLVLAGDDRIIPFLRVPDGTAISPESAYPTVDPTTPVGAALERRTFLTDAAFGDMEHDTTAVGSLKLYLPDLATGRLVETPEEIAATVNAFIAQDGQISLNKVYVTGYDFLQDSAASMRDTFAAAGKTVLSRVGDSGWSGSTMDADLFASPAHALASINNHCDHANIGTPDTGDPLTALEIDAHPGTPLRGTLVYSVGCHSGLSAPDDQFASLSPLDLPQAFLRKGVEAYIGNTGYGWGLKYGSGYSEKLAEMLTARVLAQPSVALGKALAESKRDYFIQDHRYDVFDEKVLLESTLYGLPMYQVVVSSSLVRPAEELPGASGPEEQRAAGVTLSQKAAVGTDTLPPGVTELTLNFAFGAETYHQVTTSDGTYYTLNGRASAEIGDSLQPLFTYDSRLSGTVSHGVLFTGGTFTTQSGFDPVVGTPDSSTYAPGGESPIAPASGSFIPTVNATNPRVATSLVLTDLTRMTVYTGYYEAAGQVETRFQQMGFVIYYSNSADRTPPVITDPGAGGTLHTMSGLTANFSVQAADPGSGVYRVLVAYTDRVAEWRSLDLTYNPASGRWEGSLVCKRNILYHVQAVDNAGNVGYLRQSGGDQVPGGGETGSTWVAARMFSVTLTDTDGDGLPDAYETANGLNPAVNDAGADPDFDGLTNLQEFGFDTHPMRGDTDGDGDNDGSERNNGRNPLSAGDGKRVSIGVTRSGNDVILDWPNGSGDNGAIDGPYWVYRSLDPFFSAEEELDTTPEPLPADAVTYTDAGGASGPTYYYTVTNVRYTGPPPVVLSVAPGHGHAGDTVYVLATNLQAGATVRFGSAPATQVTVLNGTTLTCRVPAGSGAVRVTVANANGQEGYLENAFTYDP